MDLIAHTVIPRHGVSCNSNGLSAMQAALLDTDRPMTLASAPTGAGKSYVYRRAVQRGERVLFVVPTRRLAQNQVVALRQDLRRDGWSEADLAQKIAEWTGDTAAEMRKKGLDVRRHRLSRLPELRYGERGEIIFITPETLSSLLLNPVVGEGLGDVGMPTLMGSFDRIVFDEFHLTQAQGLGLISLCIGLITRGPWGREVEDGPARAKVSLLSATPIDIRPVMARLGIPLGAESLIAETIIDAAQLAPTDRLLHGDVSVEFARADSPLDLLCEMQGEIAALPEDRSALVLYDALTDLQRDVPDLLAIAENLGLLATDGFLVDSSIDGQRDAAWCGRGKSLDHRRLIAATSTVEVGVTIPGLSLMIMDPGFTPLSFMQRLGRVARGAIDGRVIVRIGAAMPSERPWLKRLLERVTAGGGCLSIQDLSVFMSEMARIGHRFSLPDTAERDQFWETGDGADGMDFFAGMPMRAAFAAGVYWTILEDRLHRRGLINTAIAIHAAAPVTARVTRGWLDQVADGLRRDGGPAWRSSFEAQACILRDFSPTVGVIGIDGQRFDVSEAWLTLHTTLLDQFPATVDTDGRSMLLVDDGHSWNEFLRAGGSRPLYQRTAMLPYHKKSVLLGRAPVEEFVRAVGCLGGDLSSDRMCAAQTAARLVSATGIVPYVDSGLGSSGAGSGIL